MTRIIRSDKTAKPVSLEEVIMDLGERVADGVIKRLGQEAIQAAPQNFEECKAYLSMQLLRDKKVMGVQDAKQKLSDYSCISEDELSRAVETWPARDSVVLGWVVECYATYDSSSTNFFRTYERAMSNKKTSGVFGVPVLAHPGGVYVVPRAQDLVEEQFYVRKISEDFVRKFSLGPKVTREGFGDLISRLRISPGIHKLASVRGMVREITETAD